MTSSDESDRVSLGDLARTSTADYPEKLKIVDAPDIKEKRKPKAKPTLNFPLPQTRGQWLMIGVVAVAVFMLAGVFFWIFPTRTVEVYIIPEAPALATAPPVLPAYPAPYQVDQKVQVFNLTPDIANYQDWWVSKQQWLPVEGEWIYEVRTSDGITIMRAENQLAPAISATSTPVR